VVKFEEICCICDFEGTGGGAIEKRARSCCSVSLIRAVMSWWLRRALVNCFGRENGRSDMDEAQREIWSRCEDSRDEVMVVLVVREFVKN
jgi:hypothetical protein